MWFMIVVINKIYLLVLGKFKDISFKIPVIAHNIQYEFKKQRKTNPK